MLLGLLAAVAVQQGCAGRGIPATRTRGVRTPVQPPSCGTRPMPVVKKTVFLGRRCATSLWQPRRGRERDQSERERGREREDQRPAPDGLWPTLAGRRIRVAASAFSPRSPDEAVQQQPALLARARQTTTPSSSSSLAFRPRLSGESEQQHPELRATLVRRVRAAVRALARAQRAAWPCAHAREMSPSSSSSSLAFRRRSRAWVRARQKSDLLPTLA